MRAHPYKQFEGSAAWQTIVRALDDLAQNNDIAEQTPREYVVGYLISKLVQDGVLAKSSLRRA